MKNGKNWFENKDFTIEHVSRELMVKLYRHAKFRSKTAENEIEDFQGSLLALGENYELLNDCYQMDRRTLEKIAREQMVIAELVLVSADYLLTNNVSIENISLATGLSEEELKSIYVETLN